MNAPLSHEFEFLRKTGRIASSGSVDGSYPFFTSSQEIVKRTNMADCEGPALVFGSGGTASIHFVEGRFSASNDCYVAVPKSRLVKDAKFFYYFLKSNLHLIANGFKGAGLKHVSKKYLEAINLPVDPRVDRVNVNRILDKADAIRRKRRQALAETDTLLRSVFLALVGHRHPDYDTWPLASFESLAARRKNAMRTGPFGSDLLHSEFVDDGVAVLGIDNAVKNRFAWDERRFITN